MAFEPASVAWAVDREAVMTPSGGSGQIFRIARRYDVHWLLAEEYGGRAETSRVVMALDGTAAGARVVKRFDDGTCRVYRLDWPSA
jgi:hypothetical protein